VKNSLDFYGMNQIFHIYSLKIRRAYIKHIQRLPHLPREGIASPNYGQIKKMACEIPSNLNGMNKLYNHLG
jgi:hypothetical protein